MTPTAERSTTGRDLARMHKAIALADLLQASGIDAHLAAMMTPENWGIAAAMAEVKPPSNDTQLLVIRMLMDRERQLAKFHMQLVKAAR